ncbi:LOW QUALITY PROTEIN: hypothetical protein OSB04_012050 [Centaurea solstitialis]|uniref:Transposase n=1 Tax=Centaurea solstitialis TaxID=347529 RepID=A0AA38WQG7_9ASTR|nr:LOW QUALITY PROTEIN: hypothetical protein OSB04_012050 [Centaurea solstitialis]
MNVNRIEDSDETQGSEDEFVGPTPISPVNIDDDSGNEEVPKPTKRRKKDGNERAPYWKVFDKRMIMEDDGVERNVKKNPDNKQDKNQTKLTLKKDTSRDANVTTWKHDESRIKRALLNLFFVGELPFKFVENEAFVEYTNALNGRVSLPSRHKISRDVANFYIQERTKMAQYLSNPKTTIHLTTHTWTSSCQRVNYMVVTAHFIDENWEMHKRIINFREIDSHKGEDIGRELLDCIHGWGIKNVMSMTVDNATSNDKAIEFLIKKLSNLYDGGKHFQIRCMAHILNLVVRDGLKFQNYHVECVQRAVRYIRHSTQRISNFKKAMKDCGLETKKFLCGDTPTRWNSTFELLKTAYELREAFVEFGIKDPAYEKDLGRVPEHSDFNAIKDMFLEKFKTKTDTVSSTSTPLVHLFIWEVLDVDMHLRNFSTKVSFLEMVKDMRAKYDKYWGSYDKMNDFMYFGVLLDPTMKSDFLLHSFKTILGYMDNSMTNSGKELKARQMVREIEMKMEKLFRIYMERFDNGGPSQQESSQIVVACDDYDNDFFGDFLNTGGRNSNPVDNELRSYLKETRASYKKNFDILGWWKVNAIRFPIVARMAKDILAIQISTVASESAFSTSGRVLNEYRTSLSMLIVEALVCTQDWVRKSRKPIIDDIDDILNDDDIALEIAQALNKVDDEAKGKKATEN